VDRTSEIEFLREALRRRVEQTSIRTVAAEVQMSHGGIYNLVSGKVAPYGKTLAKLRAWYLQQWAENGVGLSVPAAHYLLEQMLSAIPRSLRPRAAVELLDGMETLFRRYGLPAPAWVHQLRRDLREETDAGRPAR
jgi:AcrR family transcriptional regulator